MVLLLHLKLPGNLGICCPFNFIFSSISLYSTPETWNRKKKSVPPTFTDEVIVEM